MCEARPLLEAGTLYRALIYLIDGSNPSIGLFSNPHFGVARG